MAPVASACWIPIGKSGAMRWGHYVLAVDPEDPDRFFVDDERNSDRLVHARIPIEGVSCEDGPTWVAREIAAALDVEVPSDGLAAWYSFAEQRVREEYEALETEQAEQRARLRSELVDLSTVEPTTVQSLWGGTRVPLKKLTLWQGDPGVGKSYAALAMVAQLSALGHRALLLQVEDGLEDTTVPRLIKLGADRSQIRAFRIGEAPVLTREGVQKLEQHLADFRPSIVIVDPITYFIGAKVDMNRANEVREVLAALGRLAEMYSCAIVAIIHMNKGAAKALYRSLGSVDFSAAVRSALMFGALDDEPERGCAIFHIKCNVGEKEDPLGYEITDAGFAWRATDLTRAEVEGRSSGPRPVKTNAARQWLKDALAAGPRDSAELKDAAYAAGISPDRLKIVSEEGWVVKAKVEGTRRFEWSLSNLVAGSVAGTVAPMSVPEDF